MPEIRWYKKLLTDDTPTEIIKKPWKEMWSSNFNVTGDAGSGIYICEAVNIYGRSRSEMIVSIGPKPADKAVVRPDRSIFTSLSAGFGSIIFLMGVIILVNLCR